MSKIKQKIRKAFKVYTNQDGVQMCEMQFSKYLRIEENIKIIHDICKGLELDYINKSDLMTAILEIKGSVGEDDE